ELQVLGQMREDREGVDEVEAVVGERERRGEAVRLEVREREMVAAPRDRIAAHVAPGDVAGVTLEVARDAAAAAAEVEDVARLLDVHVCGDRVVAGAAAAQKP